MDSAEHRYRNDPTYHAIVDTLYSVIAQAKLSPNEVREAAMLAAIRYEMDHPRPIVLVHPIPPWVGPPTFMGDPGTAEPWQYKPRKGRTP